MGQGSFATTTRPIDFRTPYFEIHRGAVLDDEMEGSEQIVAVKYTNVGGNIFHTISLVAAAR